jgi:hypothetical protein
MEDLEDLVSGLDVVGSLLSTSKAAGFNALSAAGASRGIMAAQENPGRKWMKTASTQGVSLPNEELDPLPLVTDVLTSTKLNGAGVAFPQRPFRGERLIASALFFPAVGTPVDISAAVFISPALYAGAVQIGASQGDMPLSVYAANSFGVRLSFPSMGQGSRLYIPYFTSAVLAVGDKIVVGLTVIGRAVR